MPSPSQRTELIIFQRPTDTTNEYNEGEETSSPEICRRRARVRFGTAQEKREAAQEGGVQTATFECERSSDLDAVTLKDRIVYDGSDWDITERAPLGKREIRFTGVRNL